MVSLQAFTAIHNAGMLNAYSCSFAFLHQRLGLEQNTVTGRQPKNAYCVTFKHLKVAALTVLTDSQYCFSKTIGNPASATGLFPLMNFTA